MSTRSQAPAPRAAKGRAGTRAGARAASRVERRRAEARARIVESAARRFAVAGPDAVRMDEVAEAADVARGTLYSHFSTKDELLCAIVEPVLSLAARRATGLARLGPKEAIDALLALYLELWRLHPDALRIAYKAQDLPAGGVGVLHARFLAGVMQAFERAGGAGLLRAQDAVLAGHVLRQVAVPLLELYAGRPGWERLFTDSVRALLVAGR